MAEGTGNIVGTAQVDVTVNPEGVEEQIANAVNAAIQAFEASGKNEIRLTAAVQTDGTSPAAAKAGKGKASAQGVDAAVSSVTGINDAVKKALQSNAKGFALPIDLTALRADIEKALAQPFKIKLSIEGLETLQQQISAAHIEVPLSGGQPTGVAQAAPQRPQETAAFQRTLQGVTGLSDQIHATYGAIREAMSQAGKSWGSFDPNDTSGNSTWGKLSELTEKFGPLADWLTTERYKTRAGNERTRVTGGALIDTLEAEGVDRKSVIGASALGNNARQLVTLGASGQGGVTPLADITRGIVAGFAAQSQPQNVSSAPAPAVVQSAQQVAAAVTPVAAAAVQRAEEGATVTKAEPPPRSTLSPEEARRGAASDLHPPAEAIITQSLDEALRTVKGQVNSFPVGTTARAGTGSIAFDIDPNAKRGDKTYLTGSEVRERNQGQLPTPVFDGFSYSQLVRAAQSGAFSNRAELLDERGKGTGQYALYDPTKENQATRDLIAGKVGTLDDGSKARGLKPEDFMEKMLRAGRGSIIPATQFDVPPGGQEADAPVMRVIQKILGPAARAFDSSIQAVKGGGEVGKRSGQFTGTQTRLDESAKLDFDYVSAFHEQEKLEHRISEIQNGGSLTGRLQGELKRKQGESAALSQRMSRLVEQGADPTSAIVAAMSPSQQMEALRARRASNIEQGEGRRQLIEDRVGIAPEDLAAEAQKTKDRLTRNANPHVIRAQDQLEELRRLTEEGKLSVTHENLPEGYPLNKVQKRVSNPDGTFRDEMVDEPLTTASFLRQHVTKILDDFRTAIGEDKGRGTPKAPAQFADVLGSYVSQAFDPSRKARPSGIAVPGGFTRETPYEERDLTLAEASEHRGTSGMSTQSTEDRARVKAAKDAAPIVTDLDKRKAEFTRFLTGTTGASTVDPWLMEARAKQKELRDADEVEATKGYYKGSRGRANARGAVLVPKDEMVAQGISFEKYKEDRGTTPRLAEADAIEQRIKDKSGNAREAIQRIEQIQRHADTLIRHASGQEHLYSTIKQVATSQGTTNVEDKRFYGPPVRTGEESLQHLNAMNPEEVKKVLGMTGPDFSDGMAAVIDAQQRITAGVAPGLTATDIKRRSGESQVAGLSGDKVREIAQKTDFVAGLEQPRGADPEAVAAALAGGGGSGGGRGRGTAKGDGWSPGNGPIHVIIDGQPVRVTVEGGEGGPASNYAEAADISRAKARQARTDFRYGTSRANESFVQKEIDRLRTSGKTDEQIRTLFKGTSFGNLADVALGERAGSRDTRAGLTSIRQQLGLAPTRRQVSSANQDSADRLGASLGAEAEAADRKILARGFQASVTDILQAPFFEKQRAAVDRFRTEGTQLKGLTKERANLADLFQDTRETRVAARKEANDPSLTKPQREAAEARANRADELFRDTGSRLRAVRRDETAQGQRVSDARSELPTGRDVVRNLGIGALASSGAVALGSVVFQLTSQVLSVAEEYVGAELEKLADRLTGFANTASKVGNQLSDATRAAGGQAGVAVAQTVGQVGLTNADFAAIGGDLTRRAQIEAGNKNLVDQLDLVRAGKNFRDGESGFLQPGGGIPGLTRSTGGLFGSDFGATPDALTLLTKRLPGLDPQGPFQRAFPAISSALGAAEQGFYGREKLGNASLSEGAAEGKMPWLFGDVQPDPKALEDFQTAIKGINEDLGKASSTLQVFTGATEDQADLLAKSLSDVGADANIIQRFQNLGIGLQDATGKPLTQEDIDRQGGSAAVGQKFLEDYATGAAKPNSDLMLAANQPAFQAQLGALQQTSDLALRSLQASTALQNLQQPQIPLEDRLLGSGGGSLARFAPGLEKFLPLPEANLDTWNDLKDVAGAALAEINRQTAEGTERLKEFGVSDQQIAAIKAYGEQIKTLTTESNDLQLGQQVRDYNRGLELGKRQIGDLVGLNGQLASSVKGVGDIQATNLGVQERIVIEKSRELTLLGQELAQRQINYRVALAGFGVQGMTGEERAARNEQARYEANIAQKQLDLQKGITGAQFKVVDEQNLRALQDAIYDLEKFQKDYEISVRLRGINDVIALIDKARGQLTGEAQVVMDEFKAVEQLAISTAATIAQQTGEAFLDVLAKARKTINQIKAELAEVTGGGTGTGTRTGTGGTPNVNPSTGFVLGTTSSSSTALNDGRHDTGGGGYTPSSYSGTGSVSVTFGDVTVRDDADIEKIAYEVERVIDRKSALLGLRVPLGS